MKNLESRQQIIISALSQALKAEQKVLDKLNQTEENFLAAPGIVMKLRQEAHKIIQSAISETIKGDKIAALAVKEKAAFKHTNINLNALTDKQMECRNRINVLSNEIARQISR